MPVLENVRYEILARALAEGKKQKDAYLEAYPAAAKWKSTTLDAKASRTLSDNPEIRDRVEEILDEAAKLVIMSVRERFVTLSEIARDKRTGARYRISAIDTLNKMDGTYNKTSAPREAQPVTIINDTVTDMEDDDGE